MTAPTITVEHRPELGRYEISVDGELAGFTTYEVHGTRVAFMHTEIDERFAGRGLATRLISEALDDTRARGSEVLPFCPMVRSFIARHPDYLDLVPESQRQIFGLTDETG